jgi:hypothetical protein
LSWDTNSVFENAFCGPFGKCIGNIHMTVLIHKAPEPAASLPPRAESSKDAASKQPCAQSGHIGETAASKAVEVGGGAVSHTASAWLECGLPKTNTADIDRKEDWILCTSEVQGESASCDLPMMAKLEAAQAIETYCVLTGGKGGRKITQPVWRNIANKIKEKPTYMEDMKEDAEGDTLASAHTRGFEHSARRTVGTRAEETTVEDTLDASGEAIRDIHKTSKNKPPYMKHSRAEKKPPPPGDRIVQDVQNLKRNTKERSSEAVQKARMEARNQSEELSEDLAKGAEEMKEPVVKGAGELEEASEKNAAQAAQASIHAAQKAKNVTQSTGKAAKDVRETRPPYMKGDEQTPFGGVARHVMQSPIMPTFA